MFSKGLHSTQKLFVSRDMEERTDVNAEIRSAIDGFDWSKTPIGVRSSWPAALETLLSMILDTPFPMLVMWGPDLVQIYNQGYVPIFGDKHPLSLGQNAAECWADIWEDVGPLLRGVYDRGEAVYFENLPLRMQRHGGYEQAYFTFSYSPIRIGGSVCGAICVVNETTAHVLRESEIKERAEALAALDRAKTEFFSNVSHEFRTPLTLMLGPLEELVRTLPDYDQRQTADLARRNALRLQKLVNTLLDFAAAQSGVARATKTRIDVDALTADLASEFRSAFERAGLSLTIDVGVGTTLSVDRVMYEKVVLNLLSNALKFTFAGGVEVRTGCEDGTFVLSVRDTGTGIAADDLPKLFNRFTRLPGAQSRTHEGSGIGLALVKELVELNDGRIDVESEVGRGTTFSVRFPIGTAGSESVASVTDTASIRREFLVEAESLTQTKPADAQVQGAASDFKILIADDNADLRSYLARLLGARYEVHAVSDGRELLTAAHNIVPDLIVADVMMPHMDGFEALRRLRSAPRTAQTPVNILTARAGEESAVEGLSRGADDYVVKPFVAADLLARIDALIRRTRPFTGAAVDSSFAGIIDSLSSRFISAVNVRSVFDAVTRALTPSFAEWTVVYVPRPDGILDATSLRHASAAKAELGAMIEREYPYRLHDGSALSLPFETMQTVFFPSIDPELIRGLARSERHGAVLSALDLRSMIVAPIISGNRVIASLAVVRAEGSPSLQMTIGSSSRTSPRARGSRTKTPARRSGNVRSPRPYSARSCLQRFRRFRDCVLARPTGRPRRRVWLAATGTTRSLSRESRWSYRLGTSSGTDSTPQP